jgi:hypothetical protein
MRFISDHNDQIRRLDSELLRVEDVTPALMVGMLSLAEARHPASDRRDQAERIRHLIDAEAWMDAALALLEFGLPQWKLRCITYEDGEWFCSLGKQWPLPAWLDDLVTVSHPVLPLAILSAFVEACVVTPSHSIEVAPSVSSVQPLAHEALCCDNFF